MNDREGKTIPYAVFEITQTANANREKWLFRIIGD